MSNDFRGVAETAVMMAILGLGIAAFLAPILFVWRALS
jgi:hypothetical protein